ncbi:MAG: lysylphosphatidylglycerol synthase domain-containing protein, partial [Deltaproteobacteria bacterium]|nr:lysylphosphatidylglycerol synthase domain-containing protein [Deltaproteobacteria bacterium]
VVAMLPISLSGLGLREGAFVFLFTRVGATQEQALTLSLMWFAIAAIVSVIGGIEYVRMGGRKEVVGEGAPPDLKME